jgi:hypothetical protein
MEWHRKEARIMAMLQSYRDGPKKPVIDLTTWLEEQKLILLESLIRTEIEMKPAFPIGHTTEAERQNIDDWFCKMEWQHITLTELEQEFREIYVTDNTIELNQSKNQNGGASTVQSPTTVELALPSPALLQLIEKWRTKDSVALVTSSPNPRIKLNSSFTVELTIEQPHVPPQNPVKLQLPATVELELSSPILILHSEKLLTEVSPAQSVSELIDEEEACVVDDIGAHYGFPVLRVLPTDRPPPEPGQELIDEVEACAVDAIGADHGLLVAFLRACATIRLSTIDAFSTPIQHGYTVEKPLRGYALPAPQQTVSCRPPPKPGDVSRDTRAYRSTTATRRTIRLKASRRDRLGRVTARNGTEREGGRRTVKGEG